MEPVDLLCVSGGVSYAYDMTPVAMWALERLLSIARNLPRIRSGRRARPAFARSPVFAADDPSFSFYLSPAFFDSTDLLTFLSLPLPFFIARSLVYPPLRP